MENYNPEVLHPLLDAFYKATEPLGREIIRVENAYMAGHHFDIDKGTEAEIPQEPDYRFREGSDFTLFGVNVTAVKTYKDTDAKDRVVEAHFENFSETRDPEAPARTLRIDMQSLYMTSPEIIRYIINSRKADAQKRADENARWHEQQAVIKKQQLEKLIAEFPDVAKKTLDGLNGSNTGQANP